MERVQSSLLKIVSTVYLVAHQDAPMYVEVRNWKNALGASNFEKRPEWGRGEGGGGGRRAAGETLNYWTKLTNMDEHRVSKSRHSKNYRKNWTEKHRDSKRNWFAEIKKGKLDNRGYGINNSATATELSQVISNKY